MDPKCSLSPKQPPTQTLPIPVTQTEKIPNIITKKSQLDDPSLKPIHIPDNPQIQVCIPTPFDQSTQIDKPTPIHSPQNPPLVANQKPISQIGDKPSIPSQNFKSALGKDLIHQFGCEAASDSSPKRPSTNTLEHAQISL